jgi:SAM-dependent methyltransferase
MSYPPVCDYEGSDYRTRFWEKQGRDYEDQVERIALRRLLAPKGHTLIDIGAGFGRLANEYSGYERVVLFDYSRSLLREAQKAIGEDPRFIYVAGDWYRMPFVPGLFDALVQVRTIHHSADVPALFQQLATIARPGGQYILEFASKHHIKSIIRYWIGRQRWSPFELKPIEFVDLNFDFHPRWMQMKLQQAEFTPGPMLTVSHFRIPVIKRLVPTPLLVAMDSLAQLSGDFWQLSPSVFVRSQAPVGGIPAPGDAFFACPACGSAIGDLVAATQQCQNIDCGRIWHYHDGLYDFKEPN